MKLKIKYIAQNNCYISLPESFLNSENFSLDYTKGQISRVVQVKDLDGRKVYLSFNGGLSSENDTLEISTLFGACIDLQEGDLVEARIERTNNTVKDVDLYCDKLEEYQAIMLNRDGLERGLLNQISALYDGIRFPIYYNLHNHVFLTFKSKEKIPYGCISTDAKLNIFCLEEEKKEEEKQNQSEPINGVKAPVGRISFRIKVRKDEPKDKTAENYLYIDSGTAAELGLKEEKLYKVHVKNSFWRKKEKSFAKFSRFYKKSAQGNAKGEYPNAKKLEYSFYAYLKLEPIQLNGYSENHEDLSRCIWIYQSKKLTTRLSKQDEIQIDPSETIKDMTGCRIVDLKDNQLPKLSISVHMLCSVNGNDGESRKDIFLQDIEESLNNKKKEALLVSNQLFELGGALCLLRIREKTPEKKYNEIELLKLTNSSQKPIPNGDGLSKEELGLLNEIVDFKTDTKIEELGIPQKKVEKMLQKYGRAKEKKDYKYEFYHQELHKASEIFSQDKPGKSRVLLVSGPKRSGKTTFMKCIKRDKLDYYWSYVDFKEFISPEKDIERFSLQLVKKFIEYKFEALALREKGILAFDNVHLLCKHIERIDPMNTHEIIISESLSNIIAARIRTFEKNGLPFHFILSSEGESFLNERLKKIITDQTALKSIDILEKKGFIKKTFENQNIQPSNKHIEEIVEMTEYMNLSAFILLRKKVESAIFFQRGITYNELDETILSDIIKSCIKEITASNSKNIKVELSFKDIGGLGQVKTLIKETFQNPLKYSIVYKNVPTKLPRGILLYGPSGCGKTMMAAGASAELKMNFLSVKGPELLNKYIGASEQAVRDIFEKASAQTPCIIFFDEFDSIVPRRNSGSTGVTDRVVNQFLTYLDGVSEIKDVFILAATSRPDLIDPALLRPGRIDQHIYCGYPTQEERSEILKIYTNNVDMEGVDLEKIAEESEGFSGADISAMVKNAQIKAVHNLMEEAKNDPDKAKPKELIISKELFDQAFQEVRRTADLQNSKKALKKYSGFVDKGADVTQQKQTLY